MMVLLWGGVNELVLVKYLEGFSMWKELLLVIVIIIFRGV